MQGSTIKDGVEWKPWWVRYAEFDGAEIALVDAVAAGRTNPLMRHYALVSNMTARRGGCDFSCGCGLAVSHSYPLWHGDSLEEALAAFHAAEERLLAGELA